MTALGAIGADDAAAALGLTEVDGKTQLAVRGGVNLQQSEDPLVQLIGDAIATDTEIGFNVTDQDLSKASGAKTDTIEYNKHNRISIEINPGQVRNAKVPGFWPNIDGIDVDLNASVFHEFGHAYGHFKLGIERRHRVLGLPGPTDDIAVHMENLYRVRLGLPRRTEH